MTTEFKEHSYICDDENDIYKVNLPNFYSFAYMTQEKDEVGDPCLCITIVQCGNEATMHRVLTYVQENEEIYGSMFFGNGVYTI